MYSVVHYQQLEKHFCYLCLSAEHKKTPILVLKVVYCVTGWMVVFDFFFFFLLKRVHRKTTEESHTKYPFQITQIVAMNSQLFQM